MPESQTHSKIDAHHVDHLTSLPSLKSFITQQLANTVLLIAAASMALWAQSAALASIHRHMSVNTSTIVCMHTQV